jgi:hypothetical protein
LSVASTAWTSFDSVGIQASPCSASIAPVTTSLTFGCASAAEVSMFTMRACAIGERRMARCSIPGSCTSSTYWPMPRMNRASSLRRSEP